MCQPSGNTNARRLGKRWVERDLWACKMPDLPIARCTVREDLLGQIQPAHDTHPVVRTLLPLT